MSYDRKCKQLTIPAAPQLKEVRCKKVSFAYATIFSFIDKRWLQTKESKKQILC